MDSFLGEIRIFAGNFAPKGWALCNGQTLSIRTYTALYSLLGITYGGDGKSTFGLPDLQGRAPMHSGNGAGLSPRPLGQKSGSSTVTLNASQLPVHGHTPYGMPPGRGGQGGADQTSPSGNAFSVPSNNIYTTSTQTPVAMSTADIGPAGGSQPHNNMQPYQALTFIISLQGEFPIRP